MIQGQAVCFVPVLFFVSISCLTHINEVVQDTVS